MITKNIQYLLKKNKWTHARLSDILNINRRVFSSWMDKRAVTPSIDKIIQLAELAGVSVHDFCHSDISMVPTKKKDKKEVLFTKYLSSPANIKKAVEVLLGV